MLNHGGRLATISQQYPNVDLKWIDLSTGVSPDPYPYAYYPNSNLKSNSNFYPYSDQPLDNTLDNSAYHHLPQQSPDLLSISRDYYLKASPVAHQWPNPIIANGSQQVIQSLPILWQQAHSVETTKDTLTYLKATVWLPRFGYKEHEFCWRLMGHTIKHYHTLSDITIKTNTVVVVINPNNPTTELSSMDDLLALEKNLEKHQSWLIIDEAFMDSFPSHYSRLSQPISNNTFVLRSLGKFFGLAGLRVGFVWCSNIWNNRLQQHIGPWPVSGLSLKLAENALADIRWQNQQIINLNKQSIALEKLLSEYFHQCNTRVVLKRSHLFVTVMLDNASKTFDALCHKGIYVRLFDCRSGLRFGLPNNDELQQLKQRLL
jgi:cobalamin biosynthetic protein CobC